jgi:hypothetical protein
VRTAITLLSRRIRTRAKRHEAELTELVGAARHERSAERTALR